MQVAKLLEFMQQKKFDAQVSTKGIGGKQRGTDNHIGSATVMLPSVAFLLGNRAALRTSDALLFQICLST